MIGPHAVFPFRGRLSQVRKAVRQEYEAGLAIRSSVCDSAGRQALARTRAGRLYTVERKRTAVV